MKGRKLSHWLIGMIESNNHVVSPGMIGISSFAFPFVC